MDLLTIRNIIKKDLADNNVYRTNAFIDASINKGYQLLSVLSLFDERRASTSIKGTRNFNALPVDTDGAECIAPVYVANSTTGSRLNPAQIQEFEFYNSQWEGTVESGATQSYVLINPFHHAFACIVVCPIAAEVVSGITMIGAFVPIDLTSSDEPRLDSDFQKILIHYGKFACFISEPQRSADALEAYKGFINGVNELVVSLKSRFPSGRDFEPSPVEFTYDVITTDQQEEPKTEKPKET